MVALRDSRNAADRRLRWGILVCVAGDRGPRGSSRLTGLGLSGRAHHPSVRRRDDGAADEGIIGGYPNGKFGLLDPVKRAQFAKTLPYRIVSSPKTTSTVWTSTRTRR